MKTVENTTSIEPPCALTQPQETRYTALEKLGEGGVGTVNRGHDAKLNRDVAIKRLRSSQEEHTTSPDDLRREAQVLASLNHPNIVSIYDIYEENNDTCIVMELLDGVTLDQVFKGTKLTLNAFSELVNQTQDGLLASYSAGIIHGDIKPQNIVKVKNPDGQVQYKLLDFGHAQLASERRLMKNKASTYGSIYFMAPESFQDIPPTHASDAYAMGCIYYLALTGQLPCQGDSAVEVMAAHLRNDITPLQKLRPDLPEWISQWVLWLMTLDPAERPQSPQAVKESYLELFERFSSVPKKFSQSTEDKKTTSSDKCWYVARENQIGGPHTLDTIHQFIESNSLLPTDLITNSTMPSWITTSEFSTNSQQSAG